MKSYKIKVSIQTKVSFNTDDKEKVMVYGYARVSTIKQKLQRQVDNIKAFDSTAIIFTEKYTGTKLDGREELDKLLRKVKSSDTIIFDSVSRMSRNAQEGIELYFYLYDSNINLVFLKERYIDTDTYRTSIENSISTTDNEIANIYIEATNKVIRLLAKNQIEKAFEQAQKEVDDLKIRVKEGIIKSDKKQGIDKGTKLVTKKSIQIKEKMKRHLSCFGGTDTDKQFIEDNKISRNSFYKYKRELLQE